jgi:hypothetical protein
MVYAASVGVGLPAGRQFEFLNPNPKGNPMQADNPFDRRLEAQKQMPESIRDAAIELTDTLDLCWAAAQAVFEAQATPEHALALLPMFMERADAKRQK